LHLLKIECQFSMTRLDPPRLGEQYSLHRVCIASASLITMLDAVAWLVVIGLFSFTLLCSWLAWRLWRLERKERPTGRWRLRH